MFFNTGCNGKYVWIKNNILCFITNLLCKDFVCTMTDLYFSFFCICLPYFVKCHYDYRSAITFADEGLFYKFRFPFFH